MAGRRYTGHCHCGAVTYAIDFKEGDSFRESPEYDFCVSCRRVAGSLLTGWLFIKSSQLKWLTGNDKLTLYRSSEHVERQFCSICGCQFTYKNLKRDRKSHAAEGSIDVSIGTLDEEILRKHPEIVPKRYAFYEEDGLGWMKRIMPTEEEISQA